MIFLFRKPFSLHVYVQTLTLINRVQIFLGHSVIIYLQGLLDKKKLDDASNTEKRRYLSHKALQNFYFKLDPFCKIGVLREIFKEKYQFEVKALS